MAFNSTEYYHNKMEEESRKLKEIDEKIYALQLRRKAVKKRMLRYSLVYVEGISNEPVVDILGD